MDPRGTMFVVKCFGTCESSAEGGEGGGAACKLGTGKGPFVNWRGNWGRVETRRDVFRVRIA